MQNWSVDTSRLKKHPAEYLRFVLEQKINFGLKGEKLSINDLKLYWNKLKIDPGKKRFLQKLVWG